MLEKLLPKSTKAWVKHRLLDLAREPARPDFLNGNPWSSPNVWEACVATYRDKSNPSVFEFGCGISSTNHIQTLMAFSGGSYSAVEHNRGWWTEVCAAVTTIGITKNWRVQSSHSEGNFVASLTGPNHVQITLKCRPPKTGWPDGTEGNVEWFSDYVHAADGQQYDLIVIDGRARVACANNVFESNLLKPDGYLALMEAGRGTENWLGNKTLTGDWDYQPVVEKMKARGGQIIDGIGLYSWPTVTRGFGLGNRNPPIPMECCLMPNAGH